MPGIPCTAQEFLFHPLGFFQFFGLVRFDPKSRRTSTVKSTFMVALMVYLIVEFGINMFLLVYLRQPFTKVQFLRTCSDSVFFGSETVTAFLSVLISYLYFKKKLSTVDTLCHVDELMHQIGVRLRYNRGWWKPKILIVVGGLAFWLGIDIIAFFICNPKHMPVILCIRYSAGLIYWADICYLLTVLKIIEKHFKKLNQEWVKLAGTFEADSYRQDSRLAEKIKTLIRVHSLLRQLCKIQSYLYGLQLAFLTISFLTKIVSFTYLIIARDIAYFIDEDYESNVVVYNGYFGSSIVVYFVLCFSVLHVVVNTRNEGNRTICLVHKLQMEVELLQLNNHTEFSSSMPVFSLNLNDVYSTIIPEEGDTEQKQANGDEFEEHEVTEYVQVPKKKSLGDKSKDLLNRVERFFLVEAPDEPKDEASADPFNAANDASNSISRRLFKKSLSDGTQELSKKIDSFYPETEAAEENDGPDLNLLFGAGEDADLSNEGGMAPANSKGSTISPPPGYTEAETLFDEKEDPAPAETAPKENIIPKVQNAFKRAPGAMKNFLTGLGKKKAPNETTDQGPDYGPDMNQLFDAGEDTDLSREGGKAPEKSEGSTISPPPGYTAAEDYGDYLRMLLDEKEDPAPTVTAPKENIIPKVQNAFKRAPGAMKNLLTGLGKKKAPNEATDLGPDYGEDLQNLYPESNNELPINTGVSNSNFGPDVNNDGSGINNDSSDQLNLEIRGRDTQNNPDLSKLFSKNPTPPLPPPTLQDNPGNNNFPFKKAPNNSKPPPATTSTKNPAAEPKKPSTSPPSPFESAKPPPNKAAEPPVPKTPTPTPKGRADPSPPAAPKAKEPPKENPDDDLFGDDEFTPWDNDPPAESPLEPTESKDPPKSTPNEKPKPTAAPKAEEPPKENSNNDLLGDDEFTPLDNDPPAESPLEPTESKDPSKSTPNEKPKPTAAPKAEEPSKENPDNDLLGDDEFTPWDDDPPVESPPKPTETKDVPKSTPNQKPKPETEPTPASQTPKPKNTDQKSPKGLDPKDAFETKPLSKIEPKPNEPGPSSQPEKSPSLKRNEPAEAPTRPKTPPPPSEPAATPSKPAVPKESPKATNKKPPLDPWEKIVPEEKPTNQPAPPASRRSKPISPFVPTTPAPEKSQPLNPEQSRPSSPTRSVPEAPSPPKPQETARPTPKAPKRPSAAAKKPFSAEDDVDEPPKKDTIEALKKLARPSPQSTTPEERKEPVKPRPSLKPTPEPEVPAAKPKPARTQSTPKKELNLGPTNQGSKSMNIDPIDDEPYNVPITYEIPITRVGGQPEPKKGFWARYFGIKWTPLGEVIWPGMLSKQVQVAGAPGVAASALSSMEQTYNSSNRWPGYIANWFKLFG